jgi:hypothetical protein
VGFSAPSLAKPDLLPFLPTSAADGGTQHARFMDTFERPGHTLLRFDTVLRNVGDGPLDVFTTGGGDMSAYQYVWPAGTTPVIDEDSDPPNPSSWRSLTGNDFLYYPFTGHNHFHLPRAAKYELVDGAGNLLSASSKNDVGFCLYDSYYNADTQQPQFMPSACRPGEPNWQGVIRMGISPGMGDLYASPLTDQWVDATDVMPGQYRIRATANPNQVLDESNYGNNVQYFPITVAGAAPVPASASTKAGTGVDVAISAQVYGAGMESRTRADCDNLYTDDCFTTNPDPGRAIFAVTGATGGTAAITSQAGLGATLRFTPAPGFSGTATVGYTATDSRGLTSPPATVTIQVAPGSGLSSTPPRTAGGPRKAKVTLAPRLSVVHRKGRWYVAVKGHVTKTLATRKIAVQRRAGKKRIVTMARITVGRKGNYAALVRMPSRRVTVRTFIGSTKTTKAAVSRFRTVRR